MEKDKSPTNAPQGNYKRLQILHQVSNRMIHIEDEQEIYPLMSDSINQILPGVFFIVTKLQADDLNFRIMENVGFDKYFKAIKKIVGKDPFTMDFPLKDLSEDKLKAFESRKLYQFSDGIYDLVNGTLHKTICKAVEKLLGISSVCAISFSIEKKYFGGITLFIPEKVINSGLFDKEAIMYIEMISNIASAHIQQMRDRDAAKHYESENKLAQTSFNQLINQISDVIWKSNFDDLVIHDLNNSFEKVYGYSASEFSKNINLWIEIVHPDDQEIAKKSKQDLRTLGNSESEYRIVRPDGQIRWLHDRKSVVFDKNGKPIQMGGKATDITDRKVLEERLHVKKFALGASPTAVGLADFNGNLFYVNTAYVKMWGYKKESEILGRHVSEFANSKDHVEDVLSTLKKGNNYYGEGESARLDGTKFSSLISASLIKSPEGKPICMMALFADITERKAAEVKLAEQNEQLKELISTKDKLFSIIGHDLKSPFNSILGLADVLHTDYDKMNDEERLRLIKLFHSSSKNAFALLENLLNWARIQRGKISIKKETLNLRNLVEESIKPYLLAAIKKQITVKNTISDELSLQADKNTMETVIANIFSNATKYTHSGGEVVISTQKNKSHINILIKDNGVGMSNIEMNNLFNLELSSSKPGTENEHGTGLGLIVCKEFVQKNGGKLSVESERGKGSIFKLEIPV